MKEICNLGHLIIPTSIQRFQSELQTDEKLGAVLPKILPPPLGYNYQDFFLFQAYFLNFGRPTPSCRTLISTFFQVVSVSTKNVTNDLLSTLHEHEFKFKFTSNMGKRADYRYNHPPPPYPPPHITNTTPKQICSLCNSGYSNTHMG